MPSKRRRQSPGAAVATDNGPVPKKRKAGKAAQSKATEEEEPVVASPSPDSPPQLKKPRQSKKDKGEKESNGGPGKKPASAKANSKKKKKDDETVSESKKPKSTRATKTKSSKNSDPVESKSVKVSVKTDSKTKSTKSDSTKKATKKAPPTSKKAGARTKKTKDKVVQNNDANPATDTQTPKETDKGIVLTTDQRISHPSHCHAPGMVLTLGQGDCGQLGLGDSIMERKKPFPVAGELEGKRVVQVVCGGMHTLALTDDGKMYTWGCNDEGALGREAQNEEEFVPGLIKSMEKVKVVQVSAGDSHSAALSDIGKVYCWGVFRDVNGPFGLVSTAPSTKPELVYSSSFNRAVKIVSGNNHVVLLTEQGDIYTFGCGEQGQLGRVPECFSSRGGRKGVSLLLSPQAVRFRHKKGTPHPCIDDVYAGAYHTLAVSKDKRMYIWGLNNFGQLGTNDTASRYQPEKLPEDWLMAQGSTNDSKFPFGFAGGMHHSVLCSNGRVFSMGRKEYGRLGLGQDVEEPTRPTEVRPLKNITSVACGGACSFAVTNSGRVYSWGFGTNLQTGTGDEDDAWTPVEMSGKHLEGKKVLSGSSGGQHTAVLVADETSDNET